ncbi:MAG TPA: sigma factor-like helix-turn-helix DNA-binding protein [Polyangia bacterium]|jgi:RNA polymerase sigma-70 factor (ECF subfamily)|nr:sigma factor-like helix-turn-helix DNA-binding protein [Polyangia bacterium]
MTLDQGEAVEATFQVFARAATTAQLPSDERDLDVWLLRRAAEALAPVVPLTPEVSFEVLDETLRSDATRTGEVASLTNPQREFLLWELKQGCMTAVVNCLPPGERVAFVLSSVLGLTDEEGAKAIGIKPSAFKVRLSRARKKVSDYLAPRCEHVNPRNPCRCPSRIGIALEKGFITAPPPSEVNLRKRLPFFNEEPRAGADATGLFRTLPDPEPPPELLRRILAAIQSGSWRGTSD